MTNTLKMERHLSVLKFIVSSFRTAVPYSIKSPNNYKIP